MGIFQQPWGKALIVGGWSWVFSFWGENRYSLGGKKFSKGKNQMSMYLFLNFCQKLRWSKNV